MRARLVFFGTAPLACASLRALAASPHFEIAAVVSQPDKPRGRDLEVQPSAVKSAALELNLKILQPRRAREESFLAEMRAIAPDLMVVVAYGQILPQALLDIPRHGCLNVHTSLLPRHRGAAPIQWSILEGDAETGVTIMKMDAGLDTGPVLSQRTTPVSEQETSQTLHDRLAIMGAELLVETVPPYLEGKITPRPQAAGETYARKIEKSDGLIDWTEPAVLIQRKLRAYTPWPGAFTFLESGGKRKLIKVLAAAAETKNGAAGTVIHADNSGISVGCGSGSLLITELQPEGKKRMTAAQFLAGNPIAPGQVFTR